MIGDSITKKYLLFCFYERRLLTQICKVQGVTHQGMCENIPRLFLFYACLPIWIRYTFSGFCFCYVFSTSFLYPAYQTHRIKTRMVFFCTESKESGIHSDKKNRVVKSKSRRKKKHFVWNFLSFSGRYVPTIFICACYSLY